MKTTPPTFAPDDVRFLERKFRGSRPFPEVPIRLKLRERAKKSRV